MLMWKRILWWWRRKQESEELDEELRAHLAIEARDPKFSDDKTRSLLESIGGSHVTLVHE